MNSAKLYPSVQGRVLTRERLLNRLISWEDRKLVLIHAEPGQGKSTVAADYARSLSTPCVWYNVDSEDDNPALFLSFLGQALQRVFPGAGSRVAPLPNSLPPGAVDQRLRRLVSQLFAGITKPCLIVFDDFKPAPSSPALLSVLTALIEETPPNVRLMVLSRTRPNLAAAALLAGAGMAEMSGSELRFTEGETYDLFTSVLHMPIGRNEAVMIHRNAEGWPAGLVLLYQYLSSLAPESWSTALRSREKRGFSVQVYDYLAQEVFVHLPAHLRKFLLRTSVSPYLPFALLQELWPGRQKAGDPPAGAIVEQLRSRNLFVSVLGEGPVIRYHSLFRDFLLKRLRESEGRAEIVSLYSLAARFFKQSGDHVHAVDLLIESGQTDRAVSWIEACIPDLLAGGRTDTILRWQELLPPRSREHPWFPLARAVSCRFTDPASALTLFDLARSRFRGNGSVRGGDVGRALALCGIIESCFHAGGHFSRMERAAAEAQLLLKKNSPPSRARLLLSTGIAWFFTGRLRKSIEAIAAALDLFKRHKDHFSQITCAVYLAPCALYQGDFRLARDTLQKGFEAQAAIPEEAGGKAALFLTKAMTALFEGNFQEAQESIDQCRSLADIHSLQSIGFLSLNIEGWVRIAQGEYAEAQRLLEECKRRGRDARNPFFSGSAAHLLAITHMFAGRLNQAKNESDFALGIRSQAGSSLFHSIYLIASGAIHLKLGRLRQAEKDLLSALKTLRRIKAVQQEANAHLMLALLYEKKRDARAAVDHLRRGFSIGRKLGFTYYALLTREELSDLARKAASHNICVEYCAGLAEGRSAGVLLPLLTVHCMGGFRVFRGRTLIRDSEWKSRRAKTLLKLLVSREGYSVPRERAMEMLWPDTEPARARPLFNSMLHRLRKVIEPRPGKEVSCIHQEEDVIALNKDRVWTDVHQLRHHCEQAERLKAAGRTAELMAEYKAVIELYKGDFLPENQYSDWTVEVRDELRSRYLDVLQKAAALADDRGEKSNALWFYEKLFLADSCSEKACRWLMTRYFASDRRNESIRIYERCERALNRELDLEPDEKTRRLYRSIVGG